jgi:FMN-dependent oxidoreductase (nitrilotriacetate monooxygenase family)
MGANAFHLGWFFAGASPQAWGQPFTGSIGRDWMKPDFFQDLARALERARFDYVLIEDSSYVADAWGGSMQTYLKNAIAAPRQDPAVVAALMLQATTRLGVIPTLATFAYPPYLLARLVGTLDQVSNGRAGWNLVTGSSTRAAQNFGLPDQAEHDHRYDMADEYVAVVRELWGSWEPDAIVADESEGIFADAKKVRAIDYDGTYYSVRGPLNSGPTPQGMPVIAQAGGSPRGRQFAAQHADTVVTQINGVPAMKAYRDDVRSRMVAAGRNPDSCKILFLIDPIIGESERQAQERAEQRYNETEKGVEIALANLSKLTNIDFSKIGMDTVLGEQPLETNGHQQSLDRFVSANKGKTLHEAARTMGPAGSLKLVGTPESVAAQMDEVMQEIGGDGFLFISQDLQRRTIAEMTDGLVPELQKRGLTRVEYSHEMLNDNLLEY